MTPFVRLLVICAAVATAAALPRPVSQDTTVANATNAAAVSAPNPSSQ